MTLPPPVSLQLRELLSDFERIRRFSGHFSDWSGSERALKRPLKIEISLFSLGGKSAVPFSQVPRTQKTDEEAKTGQARR
jgi:hypothetical protein